VALVLAAGGCGAQAGLTPAQRAEVARRRGAEAPHRRTLARGTSRAALLADLGRSVLRDARARHRRHQLDGRFRGAQCTVARDDLEYAAAHRAAPILLYECVAYTLRAATSPPQVIGQPYIARVDFPRATYTYCLFTPVGGEGAHTALTFAVAPSPACSTR
jgi:hypothetical protein